MKPALCRSSILAAALAVTLVVCPVYTRAQEAGAKTVLKAMSDYVGSQKTIRLTFDSDIEVITPELEKSSSPIRAKLC